MSSLISSFKKLFLACRSYVPHSPKNNENSFEVFKELPTDLQYKIFETIGGMGTQVTMLNSVPDLQKAVIRRAVIKAYNFFSSSSEGSPAKIAFNAAVKEINSDENILSVTYEKITNLAFENLLNMISESERKKLEDQFGPYSLSLEKIEKAQQILLDHSLLAMWEKVKEEIENLISYQPLLITDFPTNNKAKTIRKWLREHKGILQQIDRLLYLRGLKIIPPELSFFTGLTSLSIVEGQIRNISILKNLVKLKELNISNNQIMDISPVASLVNLESLVFDNNQISNIDPIAYLKKLRYLSLQSNQIRNITVISNCKNLQHLIIGSNKIKDISSLKKLIKLKQLRLFGNPMVIDLSIIKSLVNLIRLEIQLNQIRNISSLEKLSNIKRILVWRN